MNGQASRMPAPGAPHKAGAGEPPSNIPGQGTGETVFEADGSTPVQRLARMWRRHRLWIIGAVVFVVLSAAGFVLGNSGNRSIDALAVNNPAPAGAQAAATVLADRGVNVSATDSLAKTKAALERNAHGSSTVLFYDPRNILSPGQVSELAGAVAEHGAKLVAVTPGPLALKGLGAEFSAAGTTAATARVAAQCADPDATAAGHISGGLEPALSQGPPTGPVMLYKGARTCFIPSGQAGPAAGGLLAGNSDGDITALGFSGIINNHNLAQQGNAALVFRLLGSTPNLLWYTSSLNDVPPAQNPPGMAELTPEWMFPAAGWLLLVGLVGVLWRGRRNGPLVPEPLPVIVKASETMAGRARLYQDARAVGTATRTLQHASLTRLARALRLGHAAEPAAVVDAVAAATGRNNAQVHAILLGAPPETEKDMLTIAADLAALEEEVARR